VRNILQLLFPRSLKAQVTEKKQSNAITGYATKQVAADLRYVKILFLRVMAMCLSIADVFTESRFMNGFKF